MSCSNSGISENDGSPHTCSGSPSVFGFGFLIGFNDGLIRVWSSALSHSNDVGMSAELLLSCCTDVGGVEPDEEKGFYQSEVPRFEVVVGRPQTSQKFLPSIWLNAFPVTNFLEISVSEVCFLSLSPLSTTDCPVLALTRILPEVGSSCGLSILRQGVPMYHSFSEYQAADFWRGSAVPP